MKKKINTTKFSEAWANSIAEIWAENYGKWIIPSMVNLKLEKLTKAQRLSLERDRKKEEKRRAKKITMTVGEFEYKLYDAREY